MVNLSVHQVEQLAFKHSKLKTDEGQEFVLCELVIRGSKGEAVTINLFSKEPVPFIEYADLPA